MESQDLKITYRRDFKTNLLKTQTRKNLYALDCRIQKYLKKSLQKEIRFHKQHSKSPMNLLFYYPLPLEFDIRNLLGFYRKQRGIRIFLPKMHRESFKAVKYRLPLHKQAFGVYEPNNSCLRVKIDCAIVPVLGMDKSFRRIGFGKGMYDRFFTPYQNSRKIPKILFVARYFNYVSKVITQDYDLKGDVFITPQLTIQQTPNMSHITF